MVTKKESNERYAATKNGKTKIKEAQVRYSITEKCKITSRKAVDRYNITEHGKAKKKAYRQSEECKEKRREWDRKNQKKRTKDGTINAKNNKHRPAKLSATPKWHEHVLVINIYKKCKELNKKWSTNFVVDHIIPLQGENVCGLHCWDNLQLLDGTLNSSKNNNGRIKNAWIN